MKNKLVEGQRIRVRGLVQGVGFRPFVWRLANEAGLVGEVSNDASGVLIKISGQAAQRSRFLERLKNEIPPLARIDKLEIKPLARPVDATGFIITKSNRGAVRTTIVPDAATCDDCLEEIFSPGNRRTHYPFTNCTNCGPRLTITYGLPYDRTNTSMAAFPMCPACAREYEDPSDRRFHAQPNACPVCGPQVWLSDKHGNQLAIADLDCIKHLQSKPLDQMQQMIERGLNSPKISSAGRLFDAVAGLLGICPDRVSFEGQAAMQLQALAERCQDERGVYGYTSGQSLGWSPLWAGILGDLQKQAPPAIIAARFHNSLIRLVDETASRIAARNNTKTIVLTGGVFQNSLLLAGSQKTLRGQGYRVLSPEKFPANDGGLALGQAVISGACGRGA